MAKVPVFQVKRPRGIQDMGVNLESRQNNRLYQQQPISGWSRLPDVRCQDYPVRIHTLGRFSVQLHHQVVVTKQARQQRPMELLQALIALGGRGISTELLSQLLWPDADGDAASNTFDVTLHRLRRLLDIRSAGRHDHPCLGRWLRARLEERRHGPKSSGQLRPR